MLLPSAFSCEAAVTQLRPQRPKLVSMAPHKPNAQPQTHVQQARSGLVASCRVLQNILGNSLPSPSYLLSRTPSPKKELRNPFECAFAQNTHTLRTPTAPKGAHKRRRSDFQDDKENNSTYCFNSYDDDKTYSTPKRQRRIPLAMPLGLSAADFHSLDPPSLSNSPTLSLPDDPSSPSPPLSEDFASDLHSDSGYGPSPPTSDDADEDGMRWSIDDDRVLVETVLEKLQLSKRAWNDCAKRLGKDKDSLGRRWKMLVDEGNVGLKRGGRIMRTGLDVGSW